MRSVLCHTDAHAGSQIDRLDDDRISQPLLDRRHHGVHIAVIAGGKLHAVKYRNPVVLQDRLGHIFVHPHGGGCHIAAHKGDAHRLQISLKRAVLLVGPVDDGERQVHRNLLIFPESLQGVGQKTGLSAAADQNNPLGLRNQLIDMFILLDISHSISDIHFICLGNIYGKNIILFPVHVPDGLNRRDDRHLMLHTLSAKHHCNFRLHFPVFPSFHCIPFRRHPGWI